jgi:hypothetical protein
MIPAGIGNCTQVVQHIHALLSVSKFLKDLQRIFPITLCLRILSQDIMRRANQVQASCHFIAIVQFVAIASDCSPRDDAARGSPSR